ncbi:MAG: Crp/Fnr family transcriptional regulator [Bacteroidia bacterium]
MLETLLAFVSKFPQFSDEEVKLIVENLVVEEYKKGTILLKEGEVSTQCYFILKGCIRQYFQMEDDEKTTAFFTEEQAVVSFASYSAQIPANHYFACVEDCTVIVGDFEKEKEMYQKFPQLQALTRTMMEQDFGRTQENFATFITSSPEERYRHLLEKRPELLHRVPLHQIASYLGITPESLSRIRKRLAAKG